MAKKTSEREELLWRILVAIVSGIIIWLWAYLIAILIVVHWVIILFTGKKEKALSDFCNIWNVEAYRFMRYLTFETNERPFPFTDLKRV